MKENKKYIVIGSIILVGLAISIGFRMFYHKKNVEVVEAPAAEESVVTPTPKRYSRHNRVEAPKKALSYAEALAIYSNNGHRIQFDQQCQASPRSSVYLNGTTVMLDNRSSANRAIVIGSTTYQVPAYSYTLAKLAATTVPVTYLVDCGSQQNAATIIVE